MTTKYTVKRFGELSAAELSAWDAIHTSEPSLASPYFHPGFTGAVAAERSDVFVTVIEQGGSPVGFFPFQRGSLGAGKPVGGALSDFHGVVSRADAAWDVRGLLRGSGLSTWVFDHLLATQERFAPMKASEHPSPVMDVSQGYEAYMTGRRAEGSKQILKAEGLGRKLEREVAPMRVELDSRDPVVLERVLLWKSEQCRESGLPDIFAVAWTRALMKRLFETRESGFGGVLSALYVGDELAAAHFGMRSRTVWHYWFPSYDEKYAKFSTGLLLLLRMAHAAPGMGIRVIDLGKGETMYKQRLMSGATTIWEGRADVPGLMTAARGLRSRIEKWEGPLGAAARLPLRALARWERGRRFS